MSIASDRGWELNTSNTSVYIEAAESFVLCSIILAPYFSRFTWLLFFFFIYKMIRFFVCDQMFSKFCSFMVSFNYSNSVLNHHIVAPLLQIFQALLRYKSTFICQGVSQIFLFCLLAANLWSILRSPCSSLPLHPPLPLGGGMCQRGGRTGH